MIESYADFRKPSLLDAMNNAAAQIRSLAVALVGGDQWPMERARRMDAYRALWAKDGLP